MQGIDNAWWRALVAQTGIIAPATFHLETLKLDLVKQSGPIAPATFDLPQSFRTALAFGQYDVLTPVTYTSAGPELPSPPSVRRLRECMVAEVANPHSTVWPGPGTAAPPSIMVQPLTRIKGRINFVIEPVFRAAQLAREAEDKKRPKRARKTAARPRFGMGK